MKQKIRLSLDDNELTEFRNLVDHSNIVGLQNLVSLVVDREDEDEFIERRVKEVLSDFSQQDIDKIEMNDKLKRDLGLTLYHKRALKPHFQGILQELKINDAIKISDLEDLEMVKDCVKLIKSFL